MQRNLIPTWQAQILCQSSLEIWLHASVYICNITTPEINIILGNLGFFPFVCSLDKGKRLHVLACVPPLTWCREILSSWMQEVPGQRGACPWVYNPHAASKSHTSMLRIAITCLGFSRTCTYSITRSSTHSWPQGEPLLACISSERFVLDAEPFWFRNNEQPQHMICAK